MYTDVLVVGSGISGLSYAIELAEISPESIITVISKREVFETNTKYAQGGIAVVQDFSKDSFKKHVKDTMRAGDGLCNQKVVEKVISEGPKCLEKLMNWGAEFDRIGKNSSELELGKEGGHTEYRIVHHKDRSGFEIQRALVQRLSSLNNITLLENHTLVDIITDHHHSQPVLGRCYGAYVISNTTLSVLKIIAQITVLSTGGAGQVYNYTTNPESATGDGIAASYRAKVKIRNLHLVQFHPTALALKVDGLPFLISEAVRGFGAYLLNAKGERFMFDYDERGELASRDIVARAIEVEQNKFNQIFLSLTHLNANRVEEEFPSIAEACKKVGIRITRDLIPIRPAAHYFCGGIDVNLDAQTSLPGLYAIGECSHTGLHGANRLASNSLLEALVYAHQAVKATLKDLLLNKVDIEYLEKIPKWKNADRVIDRYSYTIADLRKNIQDLMSTKVAIFKTSKGLEEAEKELYEYYFKIKILYETRQLTTQLLELRNLINVSYLIIKQAKEATKNQGVFFNQDYA